MRISVELGMMQCVGCEWVAAFLQAKGLLKERLRIDLVVEQDAEARMEKPLVVGYPVAENMRAPLESFCDTFMFSSMWRRCECMAAASVFVRGQYMCTLEELINDPAAVEAWARLG